MGHPPVIWPCGYIDKIEPHRYLGAYQRLATQIGPAGKVCEIGVRRGGSLQLWQALFPQGIIAGADRDPACHWPDGTIRIIAAQDDPELPRLLKFVSPGGYDLIVEDASHAGALSQATFRLLWPLVKPGRWYVMEDWQIGLPVPEWDMYDGSMLEAAQSLLPLLRSRDGDCESVEYRYGLAIAAKRGT